MRYRKTTLVAPLNLPGTGGTYIHNIPLTDIVSALRFTFQVTRIGGPQIAHGLDAIPLIEIVDGSDVLLSLSGAQMDALHFFERKQLGNYNTQELGAGVDVFETAIYFGRWPNDPEIAFDPKRFVNPQLRITYNVLLYDATATILNLSVEADVFDEFVPIPIGFLQNREFYRYAVPAAAGFTYIDLPTDLVLRKLIVQPHSYAWTPGTFMDQARLDEDNMKRIPFDLTYIQWQAMNRQEYGSVEQGIAFLREGGLQPLFHAAADLPVAVWQEVMAGPNLQLIGSMGCQLTTTDTAGENTPAIGRISGLAPHFCMCFPFGDPKDKDDWYETVDVGSLRLRLHNPVPPAAGVTRIILQQMRRY